MAQTAATKRTPVKKAAAPAKKAPPPSTQPFQAPEEPKAAVDRFAKFRDPAKEGKEGPDTAASEVDEQLLYERIPQPAEPPKLRLETPLITPDMAREMMERTLKVDPSFHNRKLYPVQLARWKGLMRTGRFVFWAEDGPILVTDDGVMLNGWHRLTAVVESGIPAGFVVIRGARRANMGYYDQGKIRSFGDVVRIFTGDVPKPLAASSNKLAMRFEEYILGKRPATGWRHWPAVKGDEHTDVMKFMAARDGLRDSYGDAAKIYSRASLLIPSLMVFHFYQTMAWEEGWEKLKEFWDGLLTGADLRDGHPALTLREYGKRFGYGSLPAKREGHLMLLNLCFRAMIEGDSLKTVELGYGMPMEGPYHPKGRDQAARNVATAIGQLKERASAKAG